ncbi:MAG: hypothetical protein EXS16_04285 [Gemmataceae bacterium]|nr:hypothetical protein [Gemmataceae bacterium]
MEIYSFVWNMLAWSVTVAVLGLVTFPWAMLTYKIWHGNKEIDEELGEELFTRSFYYGWALAFAAVGFTLCDNATITWFELPEGPIHIVYYVCFVSLTAWWSMYFFSLEDFLQGIVFAVIYLYLPAAILFVLWKIIGWNIVFTYVCSWLLVPTE